MTSISISISISTPTRPVKRKAGADEESKEEKEVDSPPSSPQKKEKKEKKDGKEKEKEKSRKEKEIAVVWGALEQEAKEERASGKQRVYLYHHNCQEVGTAMSHDKGKAMLACGQADAIIKLHKLGIVNVDGLVSCDDFWDEYVSEGCCRSVVDDYLGDDETLRKRAAKVAVDIFADEIFGDEYGVLEYALTTV